jgi:hypothetical protein
MSTALTAGGLPGLVRMLARATDDVITAFNAVSTNTSNPFTFDINVENEAKPALRVLDDIANQTSRGFGPYYYLATVLEIDTVFSTALGLWFALQC